MGHPVFMPKAIRGPASAPSSPRLRPAQQRRLRSGQEQSRAKRSSLDAASSPDEHFPPLSCSTSGRSSDESFVFSESSSGLPSTPSTEAQPDGLAGLEDVAEVDLTKTQSSRVQTTLLTQEPEILNNPATEDESGTQLIQKYCCGGGCCKLNALPSISSSKSSVPLNLPNNEAFRSLGLKLGVLSLDAELSGIIPEPAATVSFSKAPQQNIVSSVNFHPPGFVKPHPPYDVFSAPVFHIRELTKPGALKRTYHFDIDVTDYPDEGNDIDFKVGGAIGVCPPNSSDAVEEVFEVLGIPRSLRDRQILVKTTGGRWPTIWGDEEARQLVTTRRELLTWCSDIQSYPPTKQLLRLLAEYAADASEKKILLFLSSSQGQPSFCDLRTGPHLSLSQLLHAFPSSKPPLEKLLAVSPQLMPRFYSLSNDPHVSSEREGLAGRRLIEIAVTVHETPNWRGSPRTGAGSGFLERLALKYSEAQAKGEKIELRIPMFRGLMANPLSKEFGVSDGPMMLIGAGVGMAPFRGFILNRLKSANCASKIWLVQGCRDASVDELYSGELGKYESQIKRVVQSRRSMTPSKLVDGLQRSSSETNVQENLEKLRRGRSHQKLLLDAQPSASGEAERARSAMWKESTDPNAESKYVQDEVLQQGEVVWDIIKSVDGRVFVCGSSAGMGEGVEKALVDVAMARGGFESREGAQRFWDEMKDAGKYIAETW